MKERMNNANKMYSATVISGMITALIYGAYFATESHLDWLTEERGVSLFKIIDGVNRYTQCLNMLGALIIITSAITLLIALVTLVTYVEICFEVKES